MMKIDPTMKVRDVALELPKSTRLFEKLKIDYCCGGDQPLADACKLAGIDFKTLNRMLADISVSSQDSPDIDTQNVTATDLIGHIVGKHHVFTKEELVRLEPLAEKIVNAHGANHPELLAIRDLLRQLCNDLRPHMFKEEQVLFPFIVGLDQACEQNRPAAFAPFGTINNPIRMMLAEHDTAGDLLREMRKLSSDYSVPTDACISFKMFYEALVAFEQDLHQHIHLENNLLFPKAIALEEILG